jgi:hypothetical protein
MEVHGELGRLDTLLKACWRLDARFHWRRPLQSLNGPDEQRIGALVHRLREIVAVELLTERMAC